MVMKKINNYIVVLVAGLVTMLSSCNTDNEGTIYTPTLPEVSFFAEQQSKIIPLEETGIDLNIRIVRGKTSGTYTVDYTATISDETAFSDESNGSVTFSDGEGTAFVVLKGQNLEIGKTYTIDLALSEENKKDMSERGISATTISVMRDYNWVDAGTVLFSEVDFGLGDVEIPIQRADGFNQYRLPDLYYNLTGGEDEDVAEGGHLQFTLDDDYNAVSIVPVASFVDLGVGYYLYYNPEKYPDYCSFSNEGNKYTLNYILSEDKSGLIPAGASFVWKEGYPKDEETE